YRSEGEFRLDVLDDPDRRFGFVDADKDRLRMFRAGGMENVEPGAVSVIDLEAEVGGSLDHLDVVVDDGNLLAAQQQWLRGDLAETAEADDKYAAGQTVGHVDPVH